MSLIGSLEDLSLGDILQIISLSQKSGVLNLRTREGDGKIVFVDGLVRSARLKDGAEDLRSVLVGGSFMSDADFDDAVADATERGVGIDAVVAGRTDLGRERVDSLLREAIESTVVAMFGWKTGEFSFDIQGEGESAAIPLTLPVGINAQYLAMEGLRVRDEAGRAGEPGHDDADAFSDAEGDSEDPEELSAHAMFGVEPPDDGVSKAEAEAAELIARAATERVEAEGRLETAVEADLEAGTLEVSEEPVETSVAVEVESVAEPEIEAAVLDAELVAAEAADDGPVVEAVEPVDAAAPILDAVRVDPVAGPLAERLAEACGSRAPLAPASLAPAVVIDLDLAALEWAKASLSDIFPRVHIFQNADLGLNRIRQYLARAEIPIVLVSPELAVDRLGGIANIRDFVRRLKSQAVEMQVIWLSHEEPPGGGGADGWIERPPGPMFNDPRRAEELSRRGAELAQCLSERITPAPRGGSGDALRRLKDATGLLRDASRRGEVLPLVMEFASETFARVAMFMVRGDSVVGMAQIGLESAGGPGDDGVRDIRLEADSCSWFRAVLSGRAPLRGAPSDDGDHTLITLLGDGVPGQAYLAPIESGGQVVALLYADNLPSDGPLGDTSALEVVLHHAGLAFDREALERALTEIVDEGGGPAAD